MLAAAGPLAAGGCAVPARVEHRAEIAGRSATFEVWALGEEDARTLAGELERALAGFMERVDVDDPSSPLATLNAAAGREPIRLTDHDVYRCVLLALDWARATRGAYDPTRRSPEGSGDETVGWGDVTVMEEARAIRFRSGRSMRLDLSTIGPGFALDIAARQFSATGAIAGLLRYERTWYGWGAPPRAEGWTVPLEESPGASLGELEIGPGRAVSIATRPERPASASAPGAAGEIRLAVAVATTGGDAAAVAEGLRASGVARAGGLLERARQVEAVLFVDGDGDPRILASATLDGRLRLTDELRAAYPGGVRYILAPSPG